MSYDKLTDKQLSGLFKSGDEQAFEVLYRRYEKTIKSLSRILCFAGGNAEDLWQEGFLGLYSAAKSFDDGKENASSFKTFAVSCIKNRMLNAIAAEKSDKRKAMTNTVPIEDNVNEPFASPEEMIIGEETRNEITEAINEKLSPFEKKVFELYVAGYKYTEIAKTLSAKPKTVDNALQRIKNKSKEIYSKPL
ncbi:MAG: sigma-70 family RNA polymerase sigma factor [Clostridia bacterium]|nr:sigma-70 family RNA polymerase sigma factor [Clostridia bacterium]